MLPSASAHQLEKILATGSRLELQRNRQGGLGGARGYLVTTFHPPRSLLHGANTRRKPAFVSSRLVAVDDALVDQGVDQRNRGPIRGLGRLLVTTGDRDGHVAHGRTHARAQRHIAGAMFFSLAGRLFGGLGVGHKCSVSISWPQHGGAIVCSDAGPLSTCRHFEFGKHRIHPVLSPLSPRGAIPDPSAHNGLRDAALPHRAPS